MTTEAWHLRKELSVGTIISLIILSVGSVAAFTRVQADIEHKASTEQVARIEARQDQFKSDIGEIKEMLKEIRAELRKN